jgi:hypothetical protein
MGFTTCQKINTNYFLIEEDNLGMSITNMADVIVSSFQHKYGDRITLEYTDSTGTRDYLIKDGVPANWIKQSPLL